MKKRIFALILAAVMTVTAVAFVGCSDDNGEAKIQSVPNK